MSQSALQKPLKASFSKRIIKLLRRVGFEFFYTVEVPHPYKDRTMFITKEVA